MLPWYFKHILIIVTCFSKDTAITHEMKSFMDMAREIEDMTGMKHIEEATGLSFDPKYYRAKKNVSVYMPILGVWSTHDKTCKP